MFILSYPSLSNYDIFSLECTTTVTTTTITTSTTTTITTTSTIPKQIHTLQPSHSCHTNVFHLCQVLLHTLYNQINFGVDYVVVRGITLNVT